MIVILDFDHNELPLSSIVFLYTNVACIRNNFLMFEALYWERQGNCYRLVAYSRCGGGGEIMGGRIIEAESLSHYCNFILKLFHQCLERRRMNCIKVFLSTDYLYEKSVNRFGTLFIERNAH